MHLFHTQSLSTPVLRDEEHKHLSRVLRLREGEHVLLSQGDGRVAEAVVEVIGRDETHCRITELHEEYHEPPVQVTLCQGILKNHHKMDWLVEKGTELGMFSFVPLHTQRTVAKSVKSDRLQKLAATAAKQCQRGRIPSVRNATHLSSATAEYKASRLVLLHESADPDARPETLDWDHTPIALFVGPEGGFSEDEVALLRDHGADILSLGPRRLRGETAGIVALARLLPLLGE
ncbi:16S rRNA (uracil(1498)-N(3))-methyltransferase [bacterium]|nr:16S rRNA (uracil(1498)-N(3))-methyltransferase [bacterium]